MWEDVSRRIGESERATFRYIDWKLDKDVFPRFKRIEGLLTAHSAEASNLLWQMYAQPNETLDETRKRFYAQMPPASGSLRLLQMANAQLLREFDGLCRQYGVEYFLSEGTLLGALRHKGCIPWDDDVDVGMEYGQLEKLMKSIGSNDRYKITVVYDLISYCKQIRFRWADDALPCFVDLFVYDYAFDAGLDGVRRYGELRAAVISQMNDIDQNCREDQSNRFVCEGDECFDDFSRLYVQIRDEAIQRGLVCAKDDAKAMMWGLENLSRLVGQPPVHPVSWFEPFVKAEYEAAEYPAPVDSESYLRAMYGDWMEMPKDRSTDITHVKGNKFTYEACDAMRSILSE